MTNHIDHKNANKKIMGIPSRDDRAFLWSHLVEKYGTKRLVIVDAYLEQWAEGRDIEENIIKKENAGRYRANTWLLKRKRRNPRFF